MEFEHLFDVHTRMFVRIKEVVQVMKTVTEEIREVCDDVCKEICRFPLVYKPTGIETVDDDYMQRMFQERCKTCPLRRLDGCMG